MKTERFRRSETPNIFRIRREQNQLNKALWWGLILTISGVILLASKGGL